MSLVPWVPAWHGVVATPHVVGQDRLKKKGKAPYTKGCFFFVWAKPKSTDFEQIELILVKEAKHVYFIVTLHDVSYLPAFELYEVKEAMQSKKYRKIVTVIGL